MFHCGKAEKYFTPGHTEGGVRPGFCLYYRLPGYPVPLSRTSRARGAAGFAVGRSYVLSCCCFFFPHFCKRLTKQNRKHLLKKFNSHFWRQYESALLLVFYLKKWRGTPYCVILVEKNLSKNGKKWSLFMHPDKLH